MASAVLNWAVKAVHVVLGAAVIFSVALINGRPAAFPDTAFYYSQGEYVGDRLGLVTPAERARSLGDPTSIIETIRHPAPTPLDAMAGARSPIYGAFLYLTVKAGGLWLTAFAQALAAALALWLVTRAAVARRAALAYYGLVAGLTLGGALPFTAMLAMPDIFDATAVIAAAGLMVYFDRLSLSARTALWALLAFSAACNVTHLIAAAAVVVVGVVLLGRKTPTLAGRTAITAAALVAAVLAAAAYAAAFTAATGHQQRLPPFLTARVLADGPGRTYLKAACDRGVPLTLCAFRHQPLDDEEQILWAVKPSQAVFTPADVDTRLALEAEQTRFVIGAAAADPLGEAGAVLVHWGRQLGSFYVSEPLRNDSDFFTHPFLMRTRIVDIVPEMAACRLPLKACASPFPFGVLRAWQQSVLMVAIAFIGWRATKADVRERLRAGDDDVRRVLVLAGLFAVAILVNALVCGAIAGVFPRYGARLIWLVPAAAMWLAAVVGPWPAKSSPVRGGGRRSSETGAKVRLSQLR